MSWCLYLLECSDGSYYAGITTGAKYTRGRSPVKLIGQQAFENRSEASKAESQIKKLPKNLKPGFFA